MKEALAYPLLLVGGQLTWGGVAWIFDVGIAPTLIVGLGIACLCLAFDFYRE